jgi:hypothetical protein
VVNAFSTKHPSTSNVKSDTADSLKNSFLDVFKDGLGHCTVTKATKKWFIYAGLAQQHQSSLSRQHCTHGLQQQNLGSAFT